MRQFLSGQAVWIIIKKINEQINKVISKQYLKNFDTIAQIRIKLKQDDFNQKRKIESIV